MILAWSFISRKIGGTTQSILSFGKSKARLSVDKDTGVTFNDVPGCDAAKFELQEVVEFHMGQRQGPLFLEKLADFLEFVFRCVATGDIVEGDAGVFIDA